MDINWGFPIVDQVRLEDTDYDIDCPKCRKTIFSRRVNKDESAVAPEFSCPNCSSSVSMVEIWWRVNDNFGDYSGARDGSFLICDNECGWQVNNKGNEKIKHDECGTEIGHKFIRNKAMEDFDLEGEDPRLKFSWGRVFKALFK